MLIKPVYNPSLKDCKDIDEGQEITIKYSANSYYPVTIAHQQLQFLNKLIYPIVATNFSSFIIMPPTLTEAQTPPLALGGYQYGCMYTWMARIAPSLLVTYIQVSLEMFFCAQTQMWMARIAPSLILCMQQLHIMYHMYIKFS